MRPQWIVPSVTVLEVFVKSVIIIVCSVVILGVISVAQSSPVLHQSDGFASSAGYINAGALPGPAETLNSDADEANPQISQNTFGGIPTVNLPLHPSSVKPGSAAFTLHVLGSDFTPGAIVRWNGDPLATTFISQGRLTAAVPANRLVHPKTVNITVTNPVPGGTSSPVPFTVTVPTSSLTFAQSTIDVGLNPSALVSGDFNRDGNIDLAVLNMNQPDPCYTQGGVGTIQILLGDGAGLFPTSSTTCFPDQQDAQPFPFLSAQNLDSNGKLGIVAEYGSFFDCFATCVTMFPGNGNGTISESAVFPINGGELAAVPLVFGDFNHDSHLDFAFTDYNEDNIPYPFGLYLGKGRSNFTSSSFVSSPDVQGISSFAGDFNGSGFASFAILDFFEAEPLIFAGPVGILVGSANLGLANPPSQPSTTLISPVWAVVGDFNSDGILDLAFADSGSSALTVLLGNGDGTFTQQMGQPDSGQTTQFIATADMNGDGILDLILLSSSNTILIYLGNGDGTFQTPLEVGVGNGASQVAVGDFNNDGRPDLAVVNSADNTVSLLIQAPGATVSSTTLTFGTVALGSTSNPRRVRLQNTGSAALQISSIVPSADFAETNTCGSVVAIAESCHVDVVFKPTQAGLTTGNITISDSAADSPQVIQLSGTGR